MANVGFSRMSLSQSTSIAIGVCLFCIHHCVLYRHSSYNSWVVHDRMLSGSRVNGSVSAISTLDTTSAVGQGLIAGFPNLYMMRRKNTEISSQQRSQRKYQKSLQKQLRLLTIATIKLQYAMNSTTISKIEGANLLSMGKHISTFARLLEAILTDASIDKRPFLDLREQYFGWWKAHKTTHLPWNATSHTTGIVLTAGQGNMVLAGHAIRTLRRGGQDRLADPSRPMQERTTLPGTQAPANERSRSKSRADQHP